MWSSVLAFCVLYAIILCALLTQHHVHSETPPSVQTSRGLVTGVIETIPVTYYRYSGIPYANVTARFKAPTPLKTWKYTVIADKEGPICPQIIEEWFPEKTSPQSEDCLFLNVYTPEPPGATTKLPVLVYIHGGGFLVGTGNAAWQGPQFFMLEGGIVLVTFNYRLGIFGFLSTGTQDAQGNAGMKDQVEALKWVKNEISNFGGDPNSITLFGESAGAASVVHHVLSPMSKDLFHKAIAESGTALVDWANIEVGVAHERAIRIGRNLGCDTENITTMVGCFNRMPVSELLQASTNIFTEQESIQYFLVFPPVIETKFDEDVFLADSPDNIVYKLNTTVPLIIGTNKDEGVTFLPDSNNRYAVIDRNLPNFFPQEFRGTNPTRQLEKFGQMLRDFYFGGRKVNETMLKGCVDLFTDQLFMYPTVETVRLLVQRQTGDVYLYNFAYSGNYRSPNKLDSKLGYKAVAHGEELGYLFYSSVLKQDLTQTTTQDYKTMQRMVKLWKTFAKTGQPVSLTDEVIKDIQWTKITNASELTYLEISTSFSEAHDYYKERIALWDGILHPTSSSLKTEPTTLLTLVSLFLIFRML